MASFEFEDRVTSDILFGRLLDRRTVVLGSKIDDEAATRIISQLILLCSEDPTEDIKLYIDSQGGDPSATLAIHDAMNFVSCDVSTWAIGQVASVGHLILASGATGKRYATTTSLISLNCSLDLGPHPDLGSSDQWFSEVARLTAKQSGRAVDQVAHDLRNGPILSAGEACAYGLVDLVVGHVPNGPQGN